MELPIAAQSYRPSADALVRAVKRGDDVQARTFAQVTEIDGATLLTNPQRSRVFMANCALDLSLPSDGDAPGLLARIDLHFQAAGASCHALHCAGTDWPPPLAAAAEARGYRPSRRGVFLLQRYRRPARRHPILQVIPGRAAYAELRRFYLEAVVAQGLLDESEAPQLADCLIDQHDDPRIESFLGRIGGRPVGVVAVLSLGQIGLITEVFVAAAHRRQGVASTLLDDLIDHCSRAQFEQVILECEDGNPAAGLYEGLGFARVATLVKYVRP